MRQRHKLVRRTDTGAALAPHLVHPAEDALIKGGILAHGVENAILFLQQTRHDVIQVGDRKRIIGAILGAGPLHPRSQPVPDFHFWIALAAQQHELALGASGNDDGHGLGLGKPGQVEEIAVTAERKVRVTAAHAHAGGGNNGDAVVAHHVHQAFAAPGKFFLIHYCQVS